MKAVRYILFQKSFLNDGSVDMFSQCSHSIAAFLVIDASLVTEKFIDKAPVTDFLFSNSCC